MSIHDKASFDPHAHLMVSRVHVARGVFSNPRRTNARIGNSIAKTFYPRHFTSTPHKRTHLDASPLLRLFELSPASIPARAMSESDAHQPLPPVPLPPVAAHDAASAAGASVHTTLYNGRAASHRLHILVVGCGMGGLAAAHCLGKAGHRITLFEAASAIGEVGAGIQITPNVSRLLRRWGAGDALERVGVRPEAIVLRRYATGERVGRTGWGDMEERYGAPYYHVHRADLHRLLFDLAEPFMTLRLNATVVGVDPEVPAVRLAGGEVVRGDVIVGADGVKSLVQRVVLGHANPAEPTGDAVYRAIVPAHLLEEDPELRELIEVPDMTGWMGPSRHVMAYNIVRRFFCLWSFLLNPA